jgi:hypothetical protein
MNKELERNYAYASHEICFLLGEGKSVDEAISKVAASPSFPLGLMQIGRLDREARQYAEGKFNG